MLKKIVALLLVALLILPATAFAGGKSDSAAAKSEGKTFEKGQSRGEAPSTQEVGEDVDGDLNQVEEGDGEEDAATQDSKGNGRHGKKGGKAVSDDDADNYGSREGDKEARKAAQKALKEQHKAEREALKEARKELKEIQKQERKQFKEQWKAEKGRISDADTDTAEETCTTEESSTVRGKGIARAMTVIARNIAKVGGNAVCALKSVYNKFATWLGLPLFDDANDSDDGTGSNETTCTIEPDDGLGADDETDTVGDDLGSDEETDSVGTDETDEL